RPRSGAEGAPPRPPAGRQARHPRADDTPRPACAVLPCLVRPRRPAARTSPARRRRVHVPPGERPPLPGARCARGAAGANRFRRRSVPPLRGEYRGLAYGSGEVSTTEALSAIREAEGLEEY